MKKLLLIVAAFICSINVCNAQNYEVLYVEQLVSDSVYRYCQPPVSGVIIYGQEGCEFNQFYVDGQLFENDSIILYGGYYNIGFDGCDYFSVAIWLELTSSDFFNPFPEPIVWKRVGESVTLGNQWTDWTWQWSNGETSPMIEVTEAGIYTVTVSDLCGSETYSVEVRDNVELYRATCDLRTNLNQVTWQTTPQQAEYISAVNIYRNTYQLVATVPYLDGSFTDDIGSESTQWQYHVVAVDNDGNECPIPSYWKRTIHLDHVQGTGGGEILQWTPYEEENPAKDVVIAYGIYDVVNGEPNHVMDVGNFTNVYAYNPNDFDGYGTVAAIFEGKSRDLDDLAFSNLTEEVLNVGENSLSSFNIYPNPSNGKITIRGTGMLTISNMIGQIIFQQEIDGESFVELPAGVYVAKLGNSNQKVVVE